ncbi:MAG: hypothetical protein DIZ77_03805 [endosymbiont of Seepiophila jonesi]|uniref:GGDEF domain-containing protein n=1 Tax=endosymbiont of Lamellibrachia luymesi TaxID=2200907 RepID=A0A370DZV7_9GAMM|nr:MAG: hypothetical protein DIZ79_06465 [endosymbiont of Lamellibrachia luymesi]RDH93932.1 MAG: hypothetical protein DIZ77_03805 [endosymbiont of Seepiophila jonesi]
MQESIRQELHGLRVEVTRLRDVELKNQEILVDLKQHADVQTAVNNILQISLLPVTLKEQLDRILDLLIEIPWLTLEKKGCIFTVDEGYDRLTMVASSGLSTSLLTMCDKVGFGRCLCGRVAQRKAMIFKDCLDHEHENHPVGIMPYGHYVLPIMVGDRMLGILNLYVEHGSKIDPLVVRFLKAATDTIAGIIEKERLYRLTYEDALTGLPNRRHLMNSLEHALMLAKRTGNKVAVMFLDLDHFKSVNDTYGHAVGDRLLVFVAQRIRGCLREMDTLVRTGGDEFVILLEVINNDLDLFALGDRIADEIRTPFPVNGDKIEIGVSIGVSIYPSHGESVEDLLKRADSAMYVAKHNDVDFHLFQ